MARPKKEPEMTSVLKSSLDAMADNVAKLSAAGAALKSSRLKESTILTLLKEQTGVPKHQIKAVLDALPQLEQVYLK